MASSSTNGGKNTYKCPLRASTDSAVGGQSCTSMIVAGALQASPSPPGCVWGTSGGWPSNGERSGSTGVGDHISESNGSRKPTGESPGTRNSAPRRNVQRVVVHPPWDPNTRCSGITIPTGSPRSASSRVTKVLRCEAGTAAASGSMSTVGGVPSGSRASLHNRWMGSSNTLCTQSGAMPRAVANALLSAPTSAVE